MIENEDLLKSIDTAIEAIDLALSILKGIVEELDEEVDQTKPWVNWGLPEDRS